MNLLISKIFLQPKINFFLNDSLIKICISLYHSRLKSFESSVLSFLAVPVVDPHGLPLLYLFYTLIEYVLFSQKKTGIV